MKSRTPLYARTGSSRRKTGRALKPLLMLMFLCLFMPETARALESLQPTIGAHEAPLLRTFRIPCDNDDAGPGGWWPRVFLVNDLLIYENGGYGSAVMAFNTRTLRRQWKRPRGRNTEIFFGSSSGKTCFYSVHMCSRGEIQVHAVDTETGSTCWIRSDRSNVAHYGTPQFVVDNMLITVGWTFISALDKTTGEDLWLIDFDLPSNRIVEHVTVEGQPLRKAEPIFWGVGGKIYAVDPATGDILWNIVIEKAEKLFSMGMLSDGDNGLGNTVVRPKNGIVLFYHYMRKKDSTLFAVDVETRTILWDFTRFLINHFELGGGDAVIAKPREVLCLNARTGGEKWRYATSKIRTGPFTISDGIVYCCESWLEGKGCVAMASLHALRKSDGALLWRYTTRGWFMAPPVIHDEKLYVVSPETGTAGHDGVIHVFDHAKTVREARSDAGIALGPASR